MHPSFLFTLCYSPLFFLLGASAQIDGGNKSATFVYSASGSGADGTAFVFSLNAVDNGDLYFHFSGPSGNSWMAVGIGNEMQDSLMFVAYASSNGTGMTLSPRIADGHSEPSYTTSKTVELISGGEYPAANTYNTNTTLMTVDAVCRNCSTWNNGQGTLDLTSTQAPFIFAVGPGTKLQSDSMTAGIKRHDFYGRFTMDMTQATSSASGAVPVPNSANGSYVLSGSSAATDTQQDNDYALIAHAVVMCLAFVIVFPLGALLLRVLESVRLHAIVQIIALVLVVVGFAAAIYVSGEYNKSKFYNSAHQIIGLLVLFAVLLQLTLGILHHRMWKRERRPTWLGKIHLYLGPAAILTGIINGGIGFDFAGKSPIPQSKLQTCTYMTPT